MIIGINFSFDTKLHLKYTNLYNELVLMQSFYQDKNYGTGVNEIAGSLVCKDAYQMQFVGLGMEYSKRKKLVSFGAKVDYDWVAQNEEPLVRQECIRLLMETFKSFEEMNIKDFNLPTFIQDFMEFLNLFETKTPQQIKAIMPDLNSETLKVYEKKWERFLRS